MLELLRRRWQIKLLALGIAFFIWLSITGQDRTVRDFNVPLEVEFAAGTVAAETPPSAVTLRLEGPRITLRKLDAFDLAVRVDLEATPTGRRGILLSREKVLGVPPGVDITMFQPARIEVDIAPRGEKSLPVQPRWDGEPAAGFELYGWRMEPAEIRVSGPQEAVAALDALATETIAIAGGTGPVRSTVSLLPLSPQLTIDELARIEMVAYIAASAGTRVVDDVPVELDSSVREAFRMRPDRISVTLKGPPDVIAGVEAAQIAVTADLPESRAGRSIRVPLKGELKVPVELRPFLTIEAIRPSRITVSRLEKESM